MYIGAHSQPVSSSSSLSGSERRDAARSGHRRRETGELETCQGNVKAIGERSRK